MIEEIYPELADLLSPKIDLSKKYDNWTFTFSDQHNLYAVYHSGKLQFYTVYLNVCKLLTNQF